MSKLDFLAKYAVVDRHYDSHDEIDKALDDAYWLVREMAIRHPNATKEHIDRALDDSVWSVRKMAIHHPNATKEHIHKALHDPEGYVRHSAQERLKEIEK